LHLQCTLPNSAARKGSSTLTIRAAKNPEYYEQPEFARDDYYTESGSVPGQWVGRGAATLSLQGGPERGQLGTLLAGRNPLTDEELPGARGRRPSNAGFDLTFTAPKSVSVLLAVGDEDIQQKILAAQERAARAGLDYLERHEAFARRGTNGVDVIRAEGFVGGMFTHEMARSGDPHLHTHVVIANRVRSADGRWTAPDMRPVYAAAKTAGTIGEAVLRDELTRSLGVRWNEVRNGTADIEGIPKEVLDHFSQRHTEILELAVARGWVSERSIEAIQRETRDHKPQIDRDVAQGQWRARAAEHGFGFAELNHTIDQPPREADVDKAALRLHLVGPYGLTKQESTFVRRQLLQEIAGAYTDGIPTDDLEDFADDFLLKDAVLVSPAIGHHPERYTTFDMLGTELDLLEIASGQVERLRPVPTRTVDEAIANSPVPLGPDQIAAVRHLTSGNDRTRLLEARAGYGKTAALAAVADAYRADGELVIGTAWQGETAQRLEREAAITSRTTAGLLSSLRQGREVIPHGAVVIVDEASMMPTRALAELADAVAKRDGRLILVGDRDQLPPIDAGGAFGSLVDRLGAARLDENRRQRDDLQRRIADLLADGRAPI
jgi:conjugative relaxase-like TrwC/TraI family protein